MGGHAFISYGHADRTYVEKLAQYLGSAGVPVWYDYKLKAGQQFDAEIQRRIDGCAVFVVVLTPGSVASEWVRREIAYAQYRKKTLIPLMLRTCDLPIALITTHYEDVTSSAMPDARVVDLLRTFTDTVTTEPAPPASAPASAPAGGPPGSGRVIAWGKNEYGQTDVPTGLRDVVAVAAGYYHSLALRGDGRVTGWGANAAVPGGLCDVVAISAGANHSLALHRDGHITAWGNNKYGQAKVPGEMRGLPLVAAIAAGENHNLALHRDGRVTIWGEAKAGVHTNTARQLSNVAAIAAGSLVSLALHGNGRITTWGRSDYCPLAVPDNAQDVVAVAAHGFYGLAVLRNGRVVGLGQVAGRVPRALTDVVSVAAGGQHRLALHRDGHITAWGTPVSGSYGLMDDGQFSVPNGLDPVIAISAGLNHNLVIVS